MGILESMRSSSDSSFMQVVLVLVMISFVGWMAMPQGDKTVAVAKVNGVSIMDTDYRQLYTSEAARLEQMRDRSLTDAEEQQLAESVRQQLIRNEALRQEAEAMGLVVSSFELRWAIVNSGQYYGYSDEDGNLDQEKYERFLTRRGFTQGAWEKQLQRSLLIQKLQQMSFAGTTISEPVLQKLFEKNQRKVAVEYVRVRSTAFHESIEVTDADIDAWLAENEGLAQEEYDRDFDTRYKHPEQLELAMIKLVAQDGQKPADLLPVANTVRQQLIEGADFAQLARKWSEDASAEQGGSLGLKPVMKIPMEMTNAIGDAAVGDLTRVITGEKDVRIYKVLQRIEASEDSFEVASRKIASETLRKEKAPAIALEFAEKQLLPAWKESGTAPADLLASKNLRTQTTRLLSAADPSNPFGPPPEVMSLAMESAKGTVLDQVFPDRTDGVYWVAKVVDRQEADLAQFELRKETIATQELMSRRVQFLESWASGVVADAAVE